MTKLESIIFDPTEVIQAHPSNVDSHYQTQGY